MKTDMRVIVGLMIAVIVAGGLFLWTQDKSEEEILGSLNPESFDVETTCVRKEGQYLICNEGHDTFFVYDDVEVYVKNVDTVVKENGDEVTSTTYETSSLAKMEKTIEKNGSALLHLWLTEQGQIETIMVVESTFTNNNASLENLEGLDPNSYHSTNVMLSIDKKGMTLAPVNYTEEEKDKFEGLVNSYQFAKEVRFYLGGITLTVDENGNQTKNTQYVKLKYRDMLRLEKGAIVHVWINADGQVTDVLVHQEKIVN